MINEAQESKICVHLTTFTFCSFFLVVETCLIELCLRQFCISFYTRRIDCVKLEVEVDKDTPPFRLLKVPQKKKAIDPVT